MALSEETAKEIREQLLSQIEKFPEEQREAAQEQIEAMNPEELEEFLIKNNLIKKEGQECVFCLIFQNKIPSYKIAETQDAIAVLDINPLSKGHILIIPREHRVFEKTPDNIVALIKKVTEKLKKYLEPKDVELSLSNATGHTIINLIPAYKDIKLERKQATKESLEALQKQLKLDIKEKKAKEVKEKKVEVKLEEKPLPKKPRRIP